MAEVPFPANSARSKAEPEPSVLKVDRVTKGGAIRRKKPIGKQLKETFVGGDINGAMQYVIFGVLIPAAKDAIADAGAQGIERLIFGESRKASRRGAPPSGRNGYVSYNHMGMGRPSEADQRRSMSRKARATHDFDEIVLNERSDAEQVIESMFDLLSQYDSVNVGDFYELIGEPSSAIDRKWGWTSLQGAGVARVRNGYLLNLPDPEPLD